MSPLRVTFGRTVGQARNQLTTAFAFGIFLAATGALFALRLSQAEGCRLSLAEVWVRAVSPVLPVLAALVGMGAWSDERRTGRLTLLLSAPVRERALVLGKFLGVWAVLMAATGLSLAFALLGLKAFSATTAVEVLPLCLSVAALALQSALWSAAATCLSALFSSAAVSACATAVLLVGLPRALWWALPFLGMRDGMAFGEVPFDAHVSDMTLGVFSSGPVLFYVIGTLLTLFLNDRIVRSFRLVGRGAAGLRMSTRFACLLACLAAALAVILAFRLNRTVSVPVEGVDFSERTYGILAGASGEVTASCFLPRSDRAFPRAARFLRALARAASDRGGVRIRVRFVDPHWNLGEAERLVRLGAVGNALVFERGRRSSVLPFGTNCCERSCASAIQSLFSLPKRSGVCWTRGHGEMSFDDFGSFGLSDIARDLSCDGYRNLPLDLAAVEHVPTDCALVVVAGAKTDFARAEVARLDAYLRQGGRLLVLSNEAGFDGLNSLLSSWGLRTSPVAPTGAKTVSGSDVVLTDFAPHAISAPLVGSRVVLESPISLEPSAAASTHAGGVDGIEFFALATAGGRCVAAGTERGVGAGSDLALRPTRLVVVGDARFVANRPLAVRAAANRDFFLNCVSYLAGADAMTSGEPDSGVLTVGFDRATWRRHVALTVLGMPLGVVLLMGLLALRRRART